MSTDVDGQASLFDDIPDGIAVAPPGQSLADAQAWLRERLDEGAPCPCCTQFAKRYRRKVNSAMARALIHQYQVVGLEYAQTTRLCPWTHEAAQLSWWGLLEEEPDRRDDGGRSSWWKVTSLGARFVRNEVRIPKYAIVYDGQLQGLEMDAYVDIRDSLGTRFNYDELMAGI